MSIKNIELIESEKQFKPEDEPLPVALSLSELLDLEVLKSPDCSSILTFEDAANHFGLTDGNNSYPIESGCPILYPSLVQEYWGSNNLLPVTLYDNSLVTYVLLSQIKQSGEINAPLDSLPARKHQWRYKEFCSDLEGVVLDVGSDRPSHSMQFLPNRCKYIGLDPYAGQGEFRLIGLGECLPIKTEAVDAVTFNTSLDHILDYHTAIDEAHRVLKQRGTLIIASYAWLYQATLLTDDVHFHHFRENQILAALCGLFEITQIKRYEDPKYAEHRYGLYISASKV